MSKSIIKRAENDFETTFMTMVNKHSREFLNTVERYSEENIDKIIEGSDNLLNIQKFAESRLNVKKHKLEAHVLIRNKETIVKQDRDTQVDPRNKDAYKQLEEEEI